MAVTELTKEQLEVLFWNLHDMDRDFDGLPAQHWTWPENTFLSKRLAKIRAERILDESSKQNKD